MTLIGKATQTQYGDNSEFSFSQCDHNHKGLITDEERGEIVCSPCGQVLHEGIVKHDSKPMRSVEDFMDHSQRPPYFADNV